MAGFSPRAIFAIFHFQQNRIMASFGAGTGLRLASKPKLICFDKVGLITLLIFRVCWETRNRINDSCIAHEPRLYLAAIRLLTHPIRYDCSKKRTHHTRHSQDGTLGDARQGLRRWAEEMARKVSDFSGSPPDAVNKFYQVAGFDVSTGCVTGATSLLAAGTWQQIISETAKIVGVDESVVAQVRRAADVSYSASSSTDPYSGPLSNPLSLQWSAEIGDVHSLDPPVSDLDLPHLISTLKRLGLKVCLCTSDSRSSTHGALKNWGIYSLFDSIVTCDDVEPGFEKVSLPSVHCSNMFSFPLTHSPQLSIPTVAFSSSSAEPV